MIALHRAMPTVLVVEDNEPSRDALSRRLERRGYAIVSAADGLRGGVDGALGASPI